jgi:hypothetical protein
VFRDISLKKIEKVFYIKQLIEIFKEPSLHQREITLIIGIGVLLLFILIIIFALLFVKPVEPSEKEIIKREKKVSKWGSYILLAFLVILLLVAGSISFIYSNKSSFCISCHSKQILIKAWQKSSHKKVNCRRCHQQPGLIGIFDFQVRLVEMMAKKYINFGQSLDLKVTNQPCLGCHKKILTRMGISRGIKIRHKEPVREGYLCLDCHSNKAIVHGREQSLAKGIKAICSSCHERNEIKADCSTCHINSGGKKRVELAKYPKVNLPEPTSCRGCHKTEERCLTCHKIELPHSIKWREGGHAQSGLTDKGLCRECHSDADCDRCHFTWSQNPHADNWGRAHPLRYRDNSKSCPRCHEMPKFCQICHTDIQSFKLKSAPSH